MSNRPSPGCMLDLLLAAWFLSVLAYVLYLASLPEFY